MSTQVGQNSDGQFSIKKKGKNIFQDREEGNSSTWQ